MNATLAVETVHDPPVPEKVTEDDMLRALWSHFAGQWAAIAQVTVSPNDLLPTALRVVHYEGAEPPSDGTDRRIDMLLCRRAQNLEKSGPYETLAVEVKVTRADFLSDVKNPAKQAAWKKAATRHAYAVPAGLVQADEVPPECGLIWVTGAANSIQWKREVKWVKRAPYTPGHRPDMPLRVLNAIVHRLAFLEANSRGYIGVKEVVEGTPEELRAQLQAAVKREKDLERKVEAAEGRAGAWQVAYSIAAADGLPCVICGKPIRPLRPNKHWFAAWRHVDKDDNIPCEFTDRAARIAQAKAEYAEADTAARESRLRMAHRFQFDGAVDAEPWRAWFRDYPNDVAPAIDVPDDQRELERRRRVPWSGTP